MTNTHVRWPYVALYYGIALTISLPFNLRFLSQALNIQAVVDPAWQSWLFAPATLGPLLAALVCYRFDRNTPRRMSLLGHDRMASFSTALVPLVMFIGAGFFSGSRGDNTIGWLHTILAFFLALLYSLGEEAGWRGYLQDALIPLHKNQRYFVVGILWWIWHARFSTVFEWTFFPLIVIFSAFILGRVAEETRSLLVVASMHTTIMLLTMNSPVPIAYYVAGGLTIFGWILVRQFFPQEQSKASDAPDDFK